MKSSPLRFFVSLLDTTAGRWLALVVAVLVWFYFIALSLAVAAMGVVILVMLLAVFILFTASISYGRMLTNQRSHLHIWLKISGFLVISGWWLCTMPWTAVFWTAIFTWLALSYYSEYGSNKIAREGSFAHQDARRVAASFDKKRLADDTGLPFGGTRTPLRDATKNYAYIGTVGAGKSVLMKLLMLQALGGIGRTPDKRAMIYDPAGEMPAQLEAMGFPSGAVIITHPFDQRSRPWAMSHDIRTAVQARALGEILIEDKPQASDPYWQDSTRNMVVAVIRYLNIVAPQVWTFRDLLCAVRSEQIIKLMMEDEPRLKHFLNAWGSDKTASNIMATLITNMEKYEAIGALWHKAETVYGNQPFSLADWVEGSAILVLGRSTTAETALKGINRIMLTRAIQLLMEGPQRSVPATWLFLDELGSLGGLKTLLTAVTELRKRGVAIVVGFQSLSHVIENFNENISNTIMANFNHIAGLRLSDAKTEEWLRQVAGKVRFERWTSSQSKNWDSGTTKTATQTFGEEDVLRPGQMNDIPIFDPAHGVGLTGFFRAGHQKWWHTIPPILCESYHRRAIRHGTLSLCRRNTKSYSPGRWPITADSTSSIYMRGHSTKCRLRHSPVQ